MEGDSGRRDIPGTHANMVRRYQNNVGQMLKLWRRKVREKSSSVCYCCTAWICNPCGATCVPCTTLSCAASVQLGCHVNWRTCLYHGLALSSTHVQLIFRLFWVEKKLNWETRSATRSATCSKPDFQQVLIEVEVCTFILRADKTIYEALLATLRLYSENWWSLGNV